MRTFSLLEAAAAVAVVGSVLAVGVPAFLRNLHASRLGSQVAVVVQAAEPQSTLGLLLAAYGLTARELDVARHVLRGDSTRAIADTLHISGHTVQDHLKSVFDKVGVRSRRDLVGRLLAGGQSETG